LSPPLHRGHSQAQAITALIRTDQRLRSITLDDALQAARAMDPVEVLHIAAEHLFVAALTAIEPATPIHTVPTESDQ
jgi:tetraacyldisaccharide-1-P 4'-kinase